MDIVVNLLRLVSDSVESRERIAFASTLSHGEHAWVSETAWQAAHRGLHVAREASLGGLTRVDLVVGGTAIEFKSTFGVWTFAPNASAERERWLGPDVVKLARGTAPGVVVVTVAALMAGVHHQRRAFKVDYDLQLPRVGALSPIQILEAGVIATERFLEPQCVQIRRVDLGAVPVAPDAGHVLLTAVVGAVNREAMEL
ncbi:hypothetical protein GA707_13810 [Nostocoides sp. F2B08]|nr:hypothetical protein GA707_13810 [Tetrasphaera sp. F2B08]